MSITEGKIRRRKNHKFRIESRDIVIGCFAIFIGFLLVCTLESAQKAEIEDDVNYENIEIFVKNNKEFLRSQLQ